MFPGVCSDCGGDGQQERSGRDEGQHSDPPDELPAPLHCCLPPGAQWSHRALLELQRQQQQRPNTEEQLAGIYIHTHRERVF